MLGLHFTPACMLLSVCSLHFTRSLHFTPGPRSAVCSPQSAFYTDRFQNISGAHCFPSLTVTSKASWTNANKATCLPKITFHTWVLYIAGKLNRVLNVEIRFTSAKIKRQKVPCSRRFSRLNLRSGSIFVSLWKLHSGGQGENFSGSRYRECMRTAQIGPDLRLQQASLKQARQYFITYGIIL